jgi:hypothetical protein
MFVPTDQFCFSAIRQYVLIMSIYLKPNQSMFKRVNETDTYLNPQHR